MFYDGSVNPEAPTPKNIYSASKSAGKSKAGFGERQ
jgi:hypothetical protein